MKTFVFINAKAEKAFLKKSNPRKVLWTTVYRRIHKKGTTTEVQKKKTRKVVKVQRDIVGATLDQIKQKRAQRPEIRAAAKEAALKYALPTNPYHHHTHLPRSSALPVCSRIYPTASMYREIKERQKKKEDLKKKAAPAPAKGAKGKKVAAPKATKAKAPKAPKGQKGR
jgi:hypothetical protein